MEKKLYIWKLLKEDTIRNLNYILLVRRSLVMGTNISDNLVIANFKGLVSLYLQNKWNGSLEDLKKDSWVKYKIQIINNLPKKNFKYGLNIWNIFIKGIDKHGLITILICLRSFTCILSWEKLLKKIWLILTLIWSREWSIVKIECPEFNKNSKKITLAAFMTLKYRSSWIYITIRRQLLWVLFELIYPMNKLKCLILQ